MTSFQIDTGDGDRGRYKVDAVQIIMDAARDAMADDATQAELDAEIARLVLQSLLAPKRAETSRRHLLKLWPLVAAMAETSPASFDHVILEFAEHLDGFR